MARRSTLQDVRAQMPAARAAARRDVRQPWWPVAAHYDRQTDHIMIGLRGGAVIGVPRKIMRELTRAAVHELEQVELRADGLHWEQLDVDVSVPGLLRRLLGDSLFVREAGRIGGRVRSEAKARAARANGAKGGRPRKRSA